MTIHQEIMIKGDPAKIYSTLMTSKEFSKVTKAPADISTDEGGLFSCFDGQITGRNIELDVNKMIIQAWRVSMWPEGIYSIVRFTLDQAGDETKLTLDHSGFPGYAADHLDGGWHKMYWEPLIEYCK